MPRVSEVMLGEGAYAANFQLERLISLISISLRGPAACRIRLGLLPTVN